MRNARWLIAARALGDAQPNQAAHRGAAPLEAVGNNQPAGIVAPNRLDQALDDPDVGCLRNIRGLVEQVKAQPLVGNALVAFGKVCPVKRAGLERLLVRPQLERFFGRIDAIARGAVKIQIDMHPVFAAQLHRLVHVLQLLLAQVPPVARVCPAAIRHRQTHKIKTPFGQQGEIALLERRVAARPLGEFLQQIESAPARQALGRGGFHLGGAQRKRGKTGHPRRQRAGFLKEFSAIHNVALKYAISSRM